MTCDDRVALLRIRESYRWCTGFEAYAEQPDFFLVTLFLLLIFGTAAPQCNWRSVQAALEAYAERDRLLSMWLPKREPSLNRFSQSFRNCTGGSMSLDVLQQEMSPRPPEAGGWELRMLPPCSPHHLGYILGLASHAPAPADATL